MKIPVLWFVLSVLLSVQCKKDSQSPASLVQGIWQLSTMTIIAGQDMAELPVRNQTMRLEDGYYEYGASNSRQQGTYHLSEDFQLLTTTDAQGNTLSYAILQLDDQQLVLEALRIPGNQAMLSEAGKLALTALNLEFLRQGKELDEAKLLTTELVATLSFTKS